MFGRATMTLGIGPHSSLQVKLCVAICERFRKCIWYLKALYKCPSLLLHFTLLCNAKQTVEKIYCCCCGYIAEPKTSLTEWT